MKISERCKKQIEYIEKLANEYKIKGDHEPYKIVFCDRDFESISELYIAYKLLIDTNNELQKAYEANKKQLDDITELYHRANDYIADFEESEDKCATLEAENNSLRNTIKNMNENFRGHLNDLEAENENLKKQKEIIEHNFDTLQTEYGKTVVKLDDKVKQLDTIKKSFEVLRALYLGDYEDEPF